MKNLKSRVLNEIDKLPRCKICDLPTPIHAVNSQFSNNNIIFIKRDDLNLLNCGCSKARKEEYIFGNLIEKNNKGIVWSSSPISNEFRIISYFGHKLGKDVVLITWKDKDVNIQYSPNVIASQRYGATILYYNAKSREQYIFDKIAEKYAQNGYYIQSLYDEALGAISYIKCGEEIDQYMQDNDIKFDYIFVCSSGATQVGIEIAKIIFEWDVKVIGINHTLWKRDFWLKEHLSNIWNETLKILNNQLSKPQFCNIVKYALPVYGVASKYVLDLCTTFEIKENILFDPFYSGKAFFGMLDLLKNYKNKNVLFIHTGGGINLYCTLYQLEKIPFKVSLLNNIKKSSMLNIMNKSLSRIKRRIDIHTNKKKGS